MKYEEGIIEGILGNFLFHDLCDNKLTLSLATELILLEIFFFGILLFSYKVPTLKWHL